MVGSIIGKYTVSDIGMYKVTLIDHKCKKPKNKDNNAMVLDLKDADRNAYCQPIVTLRPIYRDINNKLPAINSSAPSVMSGSASINVPPIVIGK